MSLRGESGEVVETFEVCVDVKIRAWDMEDGSVRYDWEASSGETSDELCDSIEEAASSARDYLGG